MTTLDRSDRLIGSIRPLVAVIVVALTMLSAAGPAVAQNNADPSQAGNNQAMMCVGGGGRATVSHGGSNGQGGFGWSILSCTGGILDGMTCDNVGGESGCYSKAADPGNPTG